MIYLLDANAVSDMITYHPQVSHHIAQSLAALSTLGLCKPIYYEILRGLYWRNASGKLRILNDEVLPLLKWIELEDSDWQQSAQFWADARNKGRQISDPDLFLAA